MINYIRNWCEGLIIAIIISIIIEMLLPEGNNKKYVKVVIGIYIIFVIINPICKISTIKIDFNSILDKSYSIETSNNLENYSNDIRQVYLIGIENSIKEDINNMGYLVESVKIIFNSDYSCIDKIEIKIIKNEKVNSVEPVVIGNKDSEEKEYYKYNNIISYLSEKYFVEKENIFFK